MAASRVALQRGHLDHAERYARSAEQLASPFTFMLGDSPSKVLKEIQTARSQAPASAQAAANSTNTPLSPSGGSPALQTENIEKARTLVREGRQALARGDVVQARKYAEDASILKAELHWSEDNPAKLLEDVKRAAPGGTAAAPGGTGVSPVSGASAAPVATLKTKEEALALLKQGREQLAKGELEEANKTAARLRAVRHIHWGLFFEDTPDKLQADVDHARTHRDKGQSVELLAEARRRLEKKDYNGAEKLAYEAQSKHGQYSIWDLGDRPSKLLADIQAARQKERTVQLPDPPKKPNEVADLSHGPLAANGNNAVVQNNPTSADRRDAGPTGTSRLVEARQMLNEARRALNNGDAVQARRLADRVRDMHVVFNAPNEDSPATIYRDLERLAQHSPANPAPGGTGIAPVKPSTQVAVNKPASLSPYLPTLQQGEGKTKGTSDNLTAQTRARRLVAEAKALQRQNRLLEARTKIEEARRLGVSFRPDEESPSQVSQQIAFLARQRIDSLIHHAGETLRYGTQAPTARCKEAENDLAQARQLAVAFGQDMQPIELTQRMVEKLRTTGNVTLVSTQTEPGHLPPTSRSDKENLTKGAASTGNSLQPTQLLDQARLELRSGETANARHLAEEAVKLGAGKAGLAVLRSIDAEEGAQNRRKANRTFDEVLQAYRNREYRRASSDPGEHRYAIARRTTTEPLARNRQHA